MVDSNVPPSQSSGSVLQEVISLRATRWRSVTVTRYSAPQQAVRIVDRHGLPKNRVSRRKQFASRWQRCRSARRGGEVAAAAVSAAASSAMGGEASEAVRAEPNADLSVEDKRDGVDMPVGAAPCESTAAMLSNMSGEAAAAAPAGSAATSSAIGGEASEASAAGIPGPSSLVSV